MPLGRLREPYQLVRTDGTTLNQETRRCEMTITVSVCQGEHYDWQSAIEYVFENTNDAIAFLTLSINQGFKCLVYRNEE